MRGVAILCVAAGALALSATTPAAAQTDRDCADFSSQEKAQRYFDSQGGSPTNNVDRLDADNDGIPCEDLPSAGGAQAQGTPAPTAAPTAAPDATPRALTQTGIDAGDLGITGSATLAAGLGLTLASWRLAPRRRRAPTPSVYSVIPTFAARRR